MKKSTVRAVLVAAAAVAVAFIGCTDVSDTTGGGVDEFRKPPQDSTITPNANLDSISAVYTQKTTVYPNTPLSALTSYLRVTAYYDDRTSKVLTPNEYQLSGKLDIGTSTVTVKYRDKEAAFTVDVTPPPTVDAVLDSISAVYDSSKAVYSDAELDDLKKNLTVTAHYDNGETRELGASEYELNGTLSITSSTITVIYQYEYVYKTTTFKVRLSVRDAYAKLYAKTPPISQSDTPVDLTFTSGTNIIEKAFSYVNANAGTYTFVLESDIEVITGTSLYTLNLTNPNTNLTIIGVGAERKITSVSANSISLELGAVQSKPVKTPDMVLTLGDNVNFKGGRVVIWTGALKMEGNAKISDGSGVIVRDSGTFDMTGSSAVYGHSGILTAGGVSVLYGGVFTMDGEASVYNNVFSNTSTDAAAGVYVGFGRGSFTMKGNASVRNNNSGIDGISLNGVGGVHVSTSSSFTMQDNASVYDNIGYGVVAKSSGTIEMSGNASVHGNIGSGARLDGGSLTMSGQASIHGNATSGILSNGGGVYASSNSKFTMNNDASVYGNTAGGEYSGLDISGKGGGVYIGSSEFNMTDNASIYGNKAVGASGSGGGLYIYQGRFTMAGGTIYGLNAPSETYKNTASQSGAALFADGNSGNVKYGDGSNIIASGGGGVIDLTVTGK